MTPLTRQFGNGKIGLYIHIPFCSSICPYCDFYSKVSTEKVIDDYTKAVINSINTSPYKDRGADTIYFGGGTPTAIGASRLKSILQAAVESFDVDYLSSEITLEANPDAMDYNYLKALRNMGFNRISLGLQSGIEAELQVLGRNHTPDFAAQVVFFAKKAGFNNISVDLMIGTPYQTQQSLLESIDYMIKLDVQHISGYMLTIEEGTLYEKEKMGRFCMDDEAVADAYLKAVALLESSGFNQYEVSNFHREGKAAVHNLKYWQGREYLGIGASAHSFIGGKRFYIPSSITDYIASNGSFDNLNGDGGGGDWAEYGMLMLRLKPGLNLKEYTSLYPEVDTDKIMGIAKELAKEGMMTIDGDTITFTPQGFMLSNYLIAQLLF